jgi:VIT1/CCC1 family predicted Fe2+/Mn2+ transporter
MIETTILWTIIGGILAVIGFMMIKDEKHKIVLAIGVVILIAGIFGHKQIYI